jgi:hypothetical protein
MAAALTRIAQLIQNAAVGLAHAIADLAARCVSAKYTGIDQAGEEPCQAARQPGRVMAQAFVHVAAASVSAVSAGPSVFICTDSATVMCLALELIFGIGLHGGRLLVASIPLARALRLRASAVSCGIDACVEAVVTLRKSC